MAVKRKQEAVKATTKDHKKAKISAGADPKKPQKGEKKSKPSKKAPPPSSSEDEGEDEDEDEDEDDELDDAPDVEDEGSSEGEDADAMSVDGDEGEDQKPAKPKNEDPEKSKKAHAEQKRLATERKLAKPKADIMIRSKKIWEQIRRTKMSKAERKPLIDELQGLIKGHITDLVFKHDLSRVIQTAVKYGSQAHREAIAAELKGRYVELAQSGYGKWLVIKIILYGKPATKTMVIEEFYGHVRKLVRHNEAGFVIQDIYEKFATPQQKALLVREFYGIEFALFKKNADTETMSLKEILTKTPEKRTTIMKSCFELISQCVEKGAVIFTIVHKAMLEYLTNTAPGTTETVEFIELVKEHIVEIAFTKDGAQVVARCLALGTAKDRKVMLKTLKPVTFDLAMGPFSYVVLTAAFETVDDTVLVSKTFFTDFETHFPEMCAHNAGRIALLYPLAGRQKRIGLALPALSLLKEVDELRTATSKKDPEVRLAELRAAISPMLLKQVAEHAPSLVEDSFGCQTTAEILLSATGADKSEAAEAVAVLAEGDPQGEQHVAGTAHGGRMLKTLVAGGFWNPKEKRVDVADKDLRFGEKLYPHMKERLASWATGAGSFVVVALLEAEGFENTDLLKQLRKSEKEIKKAAEGGNKGAQKILEKLA